jgi:protein-S-isoprenylcysteine O-methyltransferase Ste14
MDLRRLRPAEWLLGAAAIVLLVALFLPWFAVRPSAGASSYSGWQALSLVDILLFLCAAVALLAVLLQATQRSPALPVISSVCSTWAGLLAVGLVVAKLIDHPELGGLPDAIVATRGGIWLALLAAVGMVAGGWWAVADDRPGGLTAPHLESSA